MTHQKLWAARLYWESTLHAESYFITLTYADEFLPAGGSLVPSHLRQFLKRLWKFTEFRYFAVGEYGEQSWRPHYHMLLFGFQLQFVARLEELWRYGYVHTGLVERGSIRYITGYCTKGLRTGPKAREKLGVRHPEFARMSLKPGIGAGVVDSIPLQKGGVALADILTGIDVPGVLRIDGRPEFMGSYLRNRLRQRLGRESGQGSFISNDRRVVIEDPWERVKVFRALRSLAAGKAAARQSINRLKRLKI